MGQKSASQTERDRTVEAKAVNVANLLTINELTSRFVRLLKFAYLVVLVFLLSIWAFGFCVRWSILRNAHPADPILTDALREVAGAEFRRVRLLVSDHLHAPIMWGVFSPTIVLPRTMSSGSQESGLSYGLAHEWSHIARGDFLVHTLAGVTKLVCFYQPVYWWMRHQLTLSQDYLADAFAAKQGESAEDYAQFLVSIARQRATFGLSGALCMTDGKSRLRRRVSMLVNERIQLIQQSSRWSKLATAAIASSLILAFCVVRLEARPSEETVAKKDESAAKLAVESKNDLPEAITYSGTVVDRETRKPITGAIVEITHSLNKDPKTNTWKVLETTKHESDSQGKYSFTLPPEQVAQPSLYIEVNAFHPSYQPKGQSGYSHSMIVKNLKLGEPPFYEIIELSSGEPVTMKVSKPTGEPASNIRVLAYTKAPSKNPFKSFEHGAFQYAKTDDGGELRIVAPTPGDGVIWAFPKDFSPVAIRIGDKRGKMDDVVLQPGKRLSGRVVNVQGEPVPNVAVNFERDGDGDEADDFLRNNAVSNAIGSGAKTDADGRFQLHPLPSGTYRATIGSNVADPTEERSRERVELVVDDVFGPLEVTIEDDVEPEPIEIRAVPHVIVRGRFFNSAGKPRSSHEQNLFARSNGKGVFVRSSVPGKDGWFEFKVPHGVEKAEVSLSTNEHSALRWRLAPNASLQYGPRIQLGTLEADFTSLEIVRYNAPILLLKAVDDNGNLLKDYVPESTYKTRPAEERMGRFISGAQGDIGFEKQPDGRWRSNQMLPDEELTVSLKMEGYTGEPQTVSLKEGKTHEIVFVMKKNL